MKKHRADPGLAVQNGVQPSPTPPTQKIAVKQESQGDTEKLPRAGVSDAQQQAVLHKSFANTFVCVNLLRQHIKTYRNCVATQEFVRDLPEQVRAFVALRGCLPPRFLYYSMSCTRGETERMRVM